MRISFILPHYPWVPVGLFSVVYAHANQLSSKHDVRLVHAYRLRQTVVPAPGNLIILRNTWRSFRHRWRRAHAPSIWVPMSDSVKVTFLSDGPDDSNVPDGDLVIATSFNVAEYVQDYPESKGTKCYFIQGYETWEAEEEKLQEMWKKDTFKKIVVSNWLRDKAISLGAGPVWYAPNAVDHSRFYIEASVAERRPGLIGLYHSAAVKGGRDLLNILEIIHNNFSEIPVTLFGVGSRPHDFPQWIRYYKRPSSEQLRNLYNANTIFVSASYSEGFSLTPAEAMACGCVFVGTDSGGPRDYATAGETALLSAPGDIQAVCDNVSRVLGDKSFSTRLAESGVTKVAGLTWERSGQYMVQSLEEIWRQTQRSLSNG